MKTAPSPRPSNDTESKQMAKHRATRYRKPKEWRGRTIKNRWYAFIKPDLKRRQRALQGYLEQNLKSFIKKLR